MRHARSRPRCRVGDDNSRGRVSIENLTHAAIWLALTANLKCRVDRDAYVEEGAVRWRT